MTRFPNPVTYLSNPADFSWPRLWLKKGTILYHGTSTEEQFDYPDGPAWFSEGIEVAQQFSRWHDQPNPRVLVFRVTKAVQLAAIHTSEDLREFIEKIGDWDGDIIESAEMTCRAGFHGWIIPHNYPEGSDTLLCHPEDILVRIV